jgi:pimeloyl-ACP methyl ester carboxylesterase
MKVTYKLALGIIFLTGIISYCLYSCETNHKHRFFHPAFLKSSGEIDDHFLVMPDKSLAFSKNDSGFFSLNVFRDGVITPLKSSLKNAFNPSFVQGDISVMQDIKGNEKYTSTSPELIQYIGSNAIKEMYTSKKGDLIVIQLQNENTVFLIDLNTKTKKALWNITQKLHGVAFSESGNYLVISYDNTLTYVNVLSNKFTDLAIELSGDKLNPYISDNNIYFVNNSSSEYYAVFKTNLEGLLNPQKVQLVYQSNHDIRMPKKDHQFLYFVEVINNEYILKQYNMVNKKVNNITIQGVVYNYDFYKEGEIVMAYSDFYTPRCLMLYRQSGRSFHNISGSQVNHKLSFQLIQNKNSNSSAYEFKENRKTEKGVILFIHPGLDFSPRWDAILMNLCNNGYTIIAPNYPSSSGFGKTYRMATNYDAIQNLRIWKKYILQQYNNIPMYCIAASSGNILMEWLLVSDHEGIKAAVSLFGIPTANKIQIPTLYILGQNDPHVDFSSRNTMLKKQNRHSLIYITSYEDEGHWFRQTNHIQDAVSKIIDHFISFSK